MSIKPGIRNMSFMFLIPNLVHELLSLFSELAFINNCDRSKHCPWCLYNVGFSELHDRHKAKRLTFFFFLFWRMHWFPSAPRWCMWRPFSPLSPFSLSRSVFSHLKDGGFLTEGQLLLMGIDDWLRRQGFERGFVHVQRWET